MEVGCAFFIFCFREKSFQNTLSFVMDASRADSTVKKYKNAIAAWEVWCRLNKVNPKLADHEDMQGILFGCSMAMLHIAG